MSIVTTQPEMLSSAQSVSKAGLAPGDCLEYPRDGAGIHRDRRVSDDSAMDFLMQLPGVVVLEQISVPALAMARDGIILFTNAAFADMVGYGRDMLTGSAFPEVFRTVPAELCALSGVNALANLVVELQHCEGWTVRARMSKSVPMRSDDPVVLVTFEDLTEQLWMDE